MKSIESGSIKSALKKSTANEIDESILVCGPPIIHIRLDNLTGLDSREANKIDPHKIRFLN
jgi:hypothetical protein